jgi:hypothetical protein
MNRELAIGGYNTGSAFVVPLVFTESSASEPTLNFEHVGGKYFLSEIKTLGGVYTMSASREMITLAQANTPGSSESSSAGGH